MVLLLLDALGVTQSSLKGILQSSSHEFEMPLSAVQVRIIRHPIVYWIGLYWREKRELPLRCHQRQNSMVQQWMRKKKWTNSSSEMLQFGNKLIAPFHKTFRMLTHTPTKSSVIRCESPPLYCSSSIPSGLLLRPSRVNRQRDEGSRQVFYSILFRLMLHWIRAGLIEIDLREEIKVAVSGTPNSNPIVV